MRYFSIVRHTAASLALVLLSGWSVSANSASPLSEVRSFHLDAPRSEVFPLFTPLGERRWASDWNPEMLSGSQERGSTFRTRDGTGQETIWVVVEYRPAEGRVSYARAAGQSNAGLVDVACTDSDGGGTDVSVRYTLTALSQGGRTSVERLLDSAHFSAMISDWQEATAKALSKERDSR